MIVVDTNIIAYSLIEGEFTHWTRKLTALDSHWRLPSLWRHEFLNILAQYAQSDGCTLEEARMVWEKALKNFEPCEYPVDMSGALKIACTDKITGYDAQFIALAQSLEVPCVTEDKDLQKKFPHLAISMKEFCR